MNDLNFSHKSHSPIKFFAASVTQRKLPALNYLDLNDDGGEEAGKSPDDRDYCNYCKIKLESDKDGFN